MIEWKCRDSWAFYANSACTVVGTLYIDRSKTTTRMHRLRLTRSDTPTKTWVLRIERGNNLNLNGVASLSRTRLYGMGTNLIELAKAIRLKPRGSLKELLYSTVEKTLT